MNKALADAGGVIDAALNNAETLQAKVGSNVSELSTLSTTGSAKDLQLTTSIANLMGQGPSDLTKTLSEMAQQQTFLQVAQKSFSTVSGLSLLNFLK